MTAQAGVSSLGGGDGSVVHSQGLTDDGEGNPFEFRQQRSEAAPISDSDPPSVGPSVRRGPPEPERRNRVAHRINIQK